MRTSRSNHDHPLYGILLAGDVSAPPPDPAAEPPVAPGEPSEPPPDDGPMPIEDWLELPEEERPERELTPDDLQALRTSTSERAAAAERERIEAAQAQERQQREARERAAAAETGDIEYATALRAKLYGEDEEARASALREMQENEERYNRGVAADVRRKASANEQTVLSAHYERLFQQLFQEQQLDQTGAGRIAQLTQQYGGNTLRAAIEYGRELGKAGGVEEGRTDAERAARAATLSNGQRQPTRTGGGGSSAQFGDPNWVGRQKAADPGWAQRVHHVERDSYGRDVQVTNADMSLRAIKQQMSSGR